MSAPYPGRCLCGAVRYRVNDEPVTFYACHCTDCQKRSGSSFGLSMWVNRAAIEVVQGDAVLRVSSLEDGRVRHDRVCAQCGTLLWTEPEKRPERAIVRPGTLDDTSWLRPVAHLWTRSAQSWFAFPKGVARYDTQPEDFGELLRLWRERAAHEGERP